MNEKILEYNNISKNSIINIEQNEFLIYEKFKNDQSKIIGFFTDGLSTCSSIVISINNDELLFFAHIDETSDLINIVSQKFIPKICKMKIEKISLIYSKGISSIPNIKKIEKINELIKIIDNIFLSHKIIKEHDGAISCLKLLNNSTNEILMKKLIERKITIYNIYSKKYKSSTVYSNKIIDIIKNDFSKGENIIFYFDGSELSNLSKKFEFVLI